MLSNFADPKPNLFLNIIVYLCCCTLNHSNCWTSQLALKIYQEAEITINVFFQIHEIHSLMCLCKPLIKPESWYFKIILNFKFFIRNRDFKMSRFNSASLHWSAIKQDNADREIWKCFCYNMMILQRKRTIIQVNLKDYLRPFKMATVEKSESRKTEK